METICFPDRAGRKLTLSSALPFGNLVFVISDTVAKVVNDTTNTVHHVVEDPADALKDVLEDVDDNPQLVIQLVAAMIGACALCGCMCMRCRHRGLLYKSLEVEAPDGALLG